MKSLARFFSAIAQPASIVFPAISLIFMILILLQFRFYQPAADIIFVAVFCLLAAVYFICLFVARIWLPGLVALLALPAIIFFMGINVYWPIAVAALPAIFKAFRERDHLIIARILTFSMAGVLVVLFIPYSLLACKAYSPEYNSSIRYVSPDGRHMLELSATMETSLGGPGKAVVYERYPFALERAEKTLFYADWITVRPVQGGRPSDITMDVDIRWAGSESVLVNGHAVDVQKSPLLILDTDLAVYANTDKVTPTLPPVASSSPTPEVPGEFLASGVMQDDWNYKSIDLNIHIEKTYKYDTTLYIVNVYTRSAADLLTAFSHDAYGRSYEQTSEMAQRNGAVLAINGDYHGFRSTGLIIRNGELYRNKPKEDVAVIYADGSMKTFEPRDADADALLQQGAWQTFSFGPTLLVDGKVDSDSIKASNIRTMNPRTAIGQIDANHYIIIVADGRSEFAGSGISLDDLAAEFAFQGCRTAYNLDGGGTSALYFMGRIINTPCYGKERPLSDIIYFKDQ
jgi:hypothetical protein